MDREYHHGWVSTERTPVRIRSVLALTLTPSRTVLDVQHVVFYDYDVTLEMDVPVAIETVGSPSVPSMMNTHHEQRRAGW
ncbi:hypothetical protein L917_15858 [Phytophthora nicotianae]|uniref:Uncharacterized protein n=1 Tax=Phytophthora nicotianae TaxID=4792 RepID=W2G5V7_PHYNI|nr:hypothetical protein L915_16166 [Phytophthora nicotianae]ETL84287.1 hypothetical protein L917_15858 [Phytophthora nicotianae]